MRLKEKFFLLTRGKQIALIVFAIHLLAIFASFGHHFVNRKIKPTRTIVVRNAKGRTLNAEVKKEVASKTEGKAKGKMQNAKPKEIEKKAPVAAAPKKKKGAAEAVVKRPDPEKSIQEKRALREIAESLENFRREAKPKRELVIPTKSQREEEPIVERGEEPTYSEFLVAFLQGTLDLPEFGEVKVKMEIDRFGKLVDCVVLEAKSKKNGEFLKERLPDLSFPALAEFGILDSTHVFTITFRNI